MHKVTSKASKYFFLQDREVIESKLSQCIQLNTDYREAYQKIKNKKVPLCRCTWRFDILSRLWRRQRSSVSARNTSLADLTPSAWGWRTSWRCSQQSTSSQVCSTAGLRFVTENRGWSDCFAKSFKRNVCRIGNWMQQTFTEGWYLPLKVPWKPSGQRGLRRSLSKLYLVCTSVITNGDVTRHHWWP